ncbi:MAG TPA: hypothetical protein VFK81_05515 [Terriglobales bacterium]|nr:hypothetical protein [Terriglobales bacterium]
MLKCTVRLLLVACLVTGMLWAAGDAFVGDWKLNPSKSKLTDQMKVERVEANKYAFDFSGDGSFETVVADGSDQPGLFGTTLAVTIEGPDALKVVRKEKGRTIITANWKLSPDGTTLTDNFIGINPNGSTYNLNYVYKRMAGASGFGGTWESASETVNSVFVLQVRPYEGNGLSFINPSQEVTKRVKFDGKDYPTVGPNVPPGFASSVRRVNDHTLAMTDKFNGKIRDTQQIELSSDLKTLKMTVHAVGRSEPNILVFERQ